MNSIDTSAVPASLQLPDMTEAEKQQVAYIMLANPALTSGAAIIRYMINISGRLARRQLAQSEAKK